MRTINMGNTRSVRFIAAAVMSMAIVAQGEVAHRTKAMLVSEESSLHTSLSNRDVYLLRVTPRSGTAFDAIAVDSYPSYAEGLPVRLLNHGTTFSVKLIRTPYCDRPIGSTGQEPAVRCFAIDHGSWKMPKNAAPDAWWK